MPDRTVIYERRAQVVWLTLNRPHVGNAVNTHLANELSDSCRAINEDNDIRAVILTGQGNAFCRGSDLEELATLPEDAVGRSPAGIASGALAGVNSPVIAAMNGDALSAGLELALCCDIRLCANVSRLGFPETSCGLIPGGGGTQRLPRIVGRAKATEMVLLAEAIDAIEAYRVGLVSKVVPLENLLGEAEEIAARIVSRAPIALRYAKEAVNKGMDMTLEQGLRLEADLSFLLQSTRDRAEGIRAFVEKRKGQFSGE
jgi:methylglutaconyl-CoA hydratase